MSYAQTTEWRRRNHEKWKAQSKRYYQKNRNEILRKRRVRWKKVYHEEPERFFSYWLRDKYGITLDQYNGTLKSQGGVCAICKNSETAERGGKVLRLSVDHCHRTNKFRGLLCCACNTAIAQLRHIPERARSAANYLEERT